MARFLYWTDLHDEFWNKIPTLPGDMSDIDAILIAGDISTKGRHIDIAKSLFDDCGKPIIMVRGNHEFYGSCVEELIKEDEERLKVLNSGGYDLRLLNGDATVVGDTRIIGATLWTDLDLYPGYAKPIRDAVSRGINDYHQIRMRGSKQLTTGDMVEMHWNDRESLLFHLNEPYDGPTVVMTHHMPVRELLHPLREMGAIDKNLINAGFASDMWWQIKKYKVDAWICGHSHDNRTAILHSNHGEIPFLTNARGYPKEKVDTPFDPGKILDTSRKT